MRKIAVLMFVLLLSGCFMARQFENINQIQESREQASREYGGALHNITNGEQRFLACMKKYGQEKAHIDASPSDLTDTAIEKDCNGPFMLYKMSVRDRYTLEDTMNSRFGVDNETKIQGHVSILVEKGRRILTSEVITARAAKK